MKKPVQQYLPSRGYKLAITTDSLDKIRRKLVSYRKKGYTTKFIRFKMLGTVMYRVWVKK